MLALGVAGAGVLGLALTAVAVAVLPVPPIGKAVVALVGLILAVAAMGLVSTRITDRAIRAEYGEEEPEEEPGGQAELAGDDGLR